MESAALAPSNVSLLRPDQVEEMEGEKEQLEKKVNHPAIQDKGAVRDQLRRLAHQLETQRPKPYVGAEADAAVRREADLRDKISQGMLSHEEMRKCPPGAVDRHRRWEKDNKARIIEWQNIQRRLHAGDDDREVASIENFRPMGSTMNMDNALITGRQFFGPTPGAAPTITFNSAEIALLKEMAPEIALKLALLNNEQRAELKEVLKSFAEEQAA